MLSMHSRLVAWMLARRCVLGRSQCTAIDGFLKWLCICITLIVARIAAVLFCPVPSQDASSSAEGWLHSCCRFHSRRCYSSTGYSGGCSGVCAEKLTCATFPLLLNSQFYTEEASFQSASSASSEPG